MFYRYKGYYEYAKSKGINVDVPVGLDILVDGTVPTGVVPVNLDTETNFLVFRGNKYVLIVCLFYFHIGSGLSSSAAFVCSATIAIMASFDVNFPKVHYFNYFVHDHIE